MDDIRVPEIDTGELMARIRESVTRQQQPPEAVPSAAAHRPASYGHQSNGLPEAGEVEALMTTAQQRAAIRTRLPLRFSRVPFTWLSRPILRAYAYFMRDMREAVSALIRAQVATMTALAREHQRHASRVQETDGWFRSLEDRLRIVRERVDAGETRAQEVEARHRDRDGQIAGVQAQLQALDSQVSAQAALLGEERRALQQEVLPRLHSGESRLRDHEVQITGMEAQLQTLEAELSMQRAQLDEERRGRRALEQALVQCRTELVAQDRRLGLLLAEARRRLPEPLDAAQLATFAKEQEHLLDPLYLSFEDRFRGSREEIKERLRIYLPYLAQAGLGTAEAPVLDVGCGRGEWLELLGEVGLSGRGVDLNRILVALCRERGLEVAEGDAIAHLRGLPDGSLGVVTGFHIIEHLPFPVLIELFDETRRVLRPGGLAIFETPNPENIIVGSCNFYADPTHLNPLFPPTVQFFAEMRGLVEVEVLRLSERRLDDPLEFIPADSPLAPQLNPIIDIVKSRFYAAPDYAVIARKA